MNGMPDFQAVSSSLPQFELAQLDELLQKIMQLRAEKLDSITPQTEEELIRKINEGLPEEIQNRYGFLCQKLDEENMTEEEHQELLRLTEISEEHMVQRVEYMMQYAKIKNMPFKKVVAKFNVNKPESDV